MLCERCKKKESTVHLTEIIKSVRSEVHLCEHCAKEIGLNSKLNSYSLSIPDMLSFMDEGTGESFHESICSTCGITGTDVETQGRTGCPRCYDALKDYLEIAFPEFQTGYKGKRPASYAKTSPAAAEDGAPDSDSRAVLKQQLDDAVKDERYEDAARIRDSLRRDQ